MGFFKDLGKMGQDAQRAAAAAPSARADAGAQAAALQAGLTPASYDPNDPAFTPIEGVSLEEYARMTAQLVRSGLANEAEIDPFMTAQGCPAGRWKAISEAWTARMSTNRAVMTRYGMLYSQAAQ